MDGYLQNTLFLGFNGSLSPDLKIYEPALLG